jgi:hypothetical protein
MTSSTSFKTGSGREIDLEDVKALMQQHQKWT